MWAQAYTWAIQALSVKCLKTGYQWLRDRICQWSSYFSTLSIEKDRVNKVKKNKWAFHCKRGFRLVVQLVKGGYTLPSQLPLSLTLKQGTKPTHLLQQSCSVATSGKMMAQNVMQGKKLSLINI